MVDSERSVIVATPPENWMNAVPANRSHQAKTSTEILSERNDLDARVKILEAVLEAIGTETRLALAHPEISLTTLCRIEALVHQAKSNEAAAQAPPESGLRPLRRA
jgi:hypothetical protein